MKTHEKVLRHAVGGLTLMWGVSGLVGNVMEPGPGVAYSVAVLLLWAATTGAGSLLVFDAARSR